MVYWLIDVIVELLDVLVLGALSMLQVDLAFFMGLFPIAAQSHNGFRAIAFSLIVLFTLWGFIKVMATPNPNDADSPFQLIFRAVIFTFLAANSLLIINTILAYANTPYTWILGLGGDTTYMGFQNTFDIVDSGVNSAFSGLASLLIGPIIAVVFVIIVGWNMFKFTVTCVANYLTIGVLAITSPLAFAMGPLQSTMPILKSWFRMFGGQVLLLLVNVWMLRMLVSLFRNFLADPTMLNIVAGIQSGMPGVIAESSQNVADSITGSATGGVPMITWMFIIVAFIKVCLAMSSMINQLGLNIAQTGGRTFSTMLVAGMALKGIKMARGGGGSGAGAGSSGSGGSSGRRAGASGTRGAGASGGSGNPGTISAKPKGSSQSQGSQSGQTSVGHAGTGTPTGINPAADSDTKGGKGATSPRSEATATRQPEGAKGAAGKVPGTEKGTTVPGRTPKDADGWMSADTPTDKTSIIPPVKNDGEWKDSSATPTGGEIIPEGGRGEWKAADATSNVAPIAPARDASDSKVDLRDDKGASGSVAGSSTIKNDINTAAPPPIPVAPIAKAADGAGDVKPSSAVITPATSAIGADGRPIAGPTAKGDGAISANNQVQTNIETGGAINQVNAKGSAAQPIGKAGAEGSPKNAAPAGDGSGSSVNISGGSTDIGVQNNVANQSNDIPPAQSSGDSSLITNDSQSIISEQAIEHGAASSVINDVGGITPLAPNNDVFAGGDAQPVVANVPGQEGVHNPIATNAANNPDNAMRQAHNDLLSTKAPDANASVSASAKVQPPAAANVIPSKHGHEAPATGKGGNRQAAVDSGPKINTPKSKGRNTKGRRRR